MVLRSGSCQLILAQYYRFVPRLSGNPGSWFLVPVVLNNTGPVLINTGPVLINTVPSPGNQDSSQDFSGNLGLWFLVPVVLINTGPVLIYAGPVLINTGPVLINTVPSPANPNSSQDFSGNLGSWFLVPAVLINTGTVLIDTGPLLTKF